MVIKFSNSPMLKRAVSESWSKRGTVCVLLRAENVTMNHECDQNVFDFKSTVLKIFEPLLGWSTSLPFRKMCRAISGHLTIFFFSHILNIHVCFVNPVTDISVAVFKTNLIYSERYDHLCNTKCVYKVRILRIWLFSMNEYTHLPLTLSQHLLF